MKTQNRNSSVELLRILAMLGVIVLHYNNADFGGGFQYSSGLNHNVLMIVETLFISAVNLYILISGYFLAASQKRSLNKPLALMVQVCVFGAAKYILRCIVSGGFAFKSLLMATVPNNYFVWLYIALYVISPYLNLLFRRLSDKQFNVLAVLMLLLFSAWPTVLDFFADCTDRFFNGMSTINAYDSQRGYTIVNFVLMYTLGAYIRRNEVRLRKIPAAVCFILSVIILSFWALPFNQSAWAYHNPLVILSAFFALLAFLRYNFQSKWVNTLAKGAFTCFLFHDLFLPNIGVSRAVNAGLPVMLLHMALSAVGIYLVCCVAYFLWDLVTKPIFKMLANPVSKLDPLLSVDDTNN